MRAVYVPLRRKRVDLGDLMALAANKCPFDPSLAAAPCVTLVLPAAAIRDFVRGWHLGSVDTEIDAAEPLVSQHPDRALMVACVLRDGIWFSDVSIVALGGDVGWSVKGGVS